MIERRGGSCLLPSPPPLTPVRQLRSPHLDKYLQRCVAVAAGRGGGAPLRAALDLLVRFQKHHAQFVPAAQTLMRLAEGDWSVVFLCVCVCVFFVVVCIRGRSSCARASRLVPHRG